MRRITRFLLKYAGLICLLGLVLGAWGTYYSVHLFSNLRTELEELLPTDARSVLDLNEVRSRLESTNNLNLVILSDHPEESKQFVVDLAEALDKLPKNISEGVEYRINNELAFFNRRKSLFIDEEDLSRIKHFIQGKIDYEKQLYNPLTIIENRSLKEPKLDLNALQKKYTGKVDSYTRFPEGFYASANEKIRIIIVNLPGQTGGISGAKALRKSVDETIALVDPKKYSSDIQIHFSGGVQDLIEEHEALIEDLALSTVVVCVLVGLAMILYFQTLVGTLALIGSLLVGVLLTFGVAFFEVGYLNANSAFMGSIVIGNGINFGIILLARYIEERQKHKSTPRSIAIAVERTFPATIVAAMAAGLSYGSLMLTSFRGFRQFGVIGLTGMVLCWIASYTLIPAFIIILYRMGFLRKPMHKSKPWFAGFIALLVRKFPLPILGFTALLTILSISTLGRINSSVIETDLKKLRNKHSMENGSMYWGKYVDDVFQRYLSPVVILPQNQEDAQKIADEVRKVQKAEGSKSFIVNVSTIEDFVPKEQDKKIQILRQIDQLLPTRIKILLSPKERAMVKDLLSSQSFQKFKEDDLPVMVRDKFREQNGTMGKLVLVEPSISPELAKSDNLIHFVHSVREAADKIHPGTAVAGTLPVTSDLFESIVKDGPKATLFAFVAVFLLVILLFRNIITIAQCSFALLLGVLWLFGFILGFHEKINFLNFIALPITFGIGVDYGVNIFQRYRLERSKGILQVLRQTGGAVMLASMTTITGYGSLVIASNQAFVSFGKLAILGELTCVFAAVVSLPAFLWYLEQRQEKKRTRKEKFA